MNRYLRIDTKVGMGFLFFRKIEGEWKIFIIKELKAKPEIYKEAGMISFPFETQKPGESDWDTLRRLVEEETPYSWEQVGCPWVAEEKFSLIPGRTDIYTGYAFGFFDEDIPEKSLKKLIDPDIEVIGWESPGIFLNKDSFLRIETLPIFLEYSKKYSDLDLCF